MPDDSKKAPENQARKPRLNRRCRQPQLEVSRGPEEEGPQGNVKAKRSEGVRLKKSRPRRPRKTKDEERKDFGERKGLCWPMAERFFALDKLMTGTMGTPLGTSVFFKRACRMRDCAKTVYVDACGQCETQYIQNVNFCRDRLCPVCSKLRSRRLGARLLEVIAACEAEYPSRYILLTLTVENVEWADLDKTLKRIMKSWDKMIKRIMRRGSVLGWVRTLEVTVSKLGLAHPHLHILLQVPPEYFDPSSGLCYFRKDDLIQMWQQCLKTPYAPSIKINAVKDDGDLDGAVREVTKYIAKGSDVSRLSTTNFMFYVVAMHGMRTFASGRRMKVSGKDLEKLENLLDDGKPATHAKGVCGNCGGDLHEEKWVWDKKLGIYHLVFRQEVVVDLKNPNTIIINNYEGGVVNVGGGVGG